jgi:O-antigen/teichoic acid export membrane protein
VPIFFGNEFSESVVAIWWLLPGTVALAGTKILASYIFSQGKPLINSYITIASLSVTLACDFALIPFFGVPGAAAASSIAYSASLVLSLIVYRRLSGRSLREAVLVQGSDLRLYLETARNARARLFPTTAVAGDQEGGP